MKIRWLIIGWIIFSLLFYLFIRIFIFRSFEDITFPLDAPLWNLLDCFIGASLIWVFRKIFNLLNEDSLSISRDSLILTAMIPFTTLIVASFGIGIEQFIFGKTHTYYSWVWNYLFHFVTQTVVSLSCISYFYILAINKIQERLLSAQKAKSEMELKTLRQNVEPHFLFNNLNVLSSLIESNPARANEFLSTMSEIYRYILRSQTADFVPLTDEIEFARDYVYLLEERFGAAYDFDWQIREEELSGRLIVPVSLQSLIENAVKHNAGNPENPLLITIKLENDQLTVENEMREKLLTFQTNKSGLENLRHRYAFLTEKPLEITQNASLFKVKLPLLHAE